MKLFTLLMAGTIFLFASAQADARKGAERVGARKPVPVQEEKQRETDVHVSVDQSVLTDGAKASDVPSVMTLEQITTWVGGLLGQGEGGTDPEGTQEVALGVLEAEEAGKKDIKDLDPDLVKKIEDLLKRYPRKNTTVTSINSGVAHTAGRDMTVVHNAPVLNLSGFTGTKEVIVVEEIESIEPAIRGFSAIGHHHGNHRFLPDWHDRSRFRGLRHPGR